MQPFISAPAYARFGVGRAKPALYASDDAKARATRRYQRFVERCLRLDIFNTPPRHIHANYQAAR